MPAKESKYKFRAVLILLVFGISLFPRQVLHNFVTSHKHVKYAGHTGQAQLSVASFACSADDLFLQQSYTDTVFEIPSLPDTYFAAKGISIIHRLSTDNNEVTALRGPPAHA